ncbi:MAG TPA: hypothetical protein VFC33_00995 [Acidimicrobiia bacterium]|nr:hypothetical protein [Acidimicrobiia bacterium]
MTRFRFLALAAPALAIAVVLSGCGVASHPAATVGGHDISLTSFQDDLSHFRDNKQFRNVYQQQIGSPLTHTDGTVDSRWSAIWLTQLVELQLTDNLFAQRHLTTSATDRQGAQQQADQFFGSAAVFNAFPASFRNEFIDKLARFQALARDITQTAPDQTTAQNRLSTELLGALRKANVRVNPRFGTVDLTSQGFQISPPKAPNVQEQRGTTTTTGTPLLGTTPGG